MTKLEVLSLTFDIYSSAEILFLSSNKFSGQLVMSQKAEIGSPLRGLYLSDNQFDGLIPLMLCEFKELEAIFLDENELTGNLPTCLSLLDKLTQLYVFKNQLDGEIPQEFSVMLGLGKFVHVVLLVWVIVLLVATLTSYTRP